MQLNEAHILRLMELAGILNEDRINKLIAQKFSPEIIQFATNFSKATLRGEPTEEAIRQNHYIPWIAQQAKSNPEIMNSKEQLDTIVSWIRNTNFNKINTNMPFSEAYKKAHAWLQLNNKNTQTGERLDGGKVLKEYPNGYKWIRATEVNWCINAGEANGWCFSQQNRAEEFVGLGGIGTNKAGYFLLDENNHPHVALQYDSFTGIVDDVQGTHNTPIPGHLFQMVLDILITLPVITDVQGHKDSFWKTFDDPKNAKWRPKFLSLPNVQISSEIKLKRGIPLNQEEVNHLSINAKLSNGYPLTKEEISKLTLEQKLAYDYLTPAQKNALPLYLKLDYDILLNTKDIKILNQPISEKIRKVATKKATIKDLFIINHLGNVNEKLPLQKDFEGFDNYLIEDDDLFLKMEENVYDKFYSGLDEYNKWYENMALSSYGYSGDKAGEEELDYMYNYLSDENQKKIKELSELLGVNNQYDFEQEGQYKKFIETNLNNSQDIFDEYIYGVGEAIYNAKKQSIQNALKEQIFKYEDGYLKLPWKELWNFIKEHPIEKLKDLKDLQINGDIDLEGPYSDYYEDISDSDLEQMNKDVADKLENIEELIMENPNYAKHIQEFQNLERNLKLVRGNFPIFVNGGRKGEGIYKKSLSKRDIYIVSVNYEAGTILIYMLDFLDKKKTKFKEARKGNIAFDSLVNYIQQYTLFQETELRKKIQQILLEDFRYEYDRTAYVPPFNVISTAQKALQVVQNNKLIQPSGSNEGSGLQKAKSLISKEPITHGQLKRMKAFFDNNAASISKERASGKNINTSSLLQTWDLWGGDAAKSWVETEINKTKSSNQTSKKVRNSDMIARDNRIMDTTNTRIHR